MIVIRQGIVQEILYENDKIQILVINSEKVCSKAINYIDISGRVNVGEKVFLNNTAAALGLGTGGYDFVIKANFSKLKDIKQDGHIIKLRYTPMQFSCLSVEERNAEFNNIFNKFESLHGMPCVYAPLHSSVAPFAATLKYIRGMNVKIAYIMTEGGCLPLSFSHTVRELKKKNLIDTTITYGNAFGGDYETINVYSALITAKYIANADICLIAMGPGIVGSNTKYGHTAVEQALILDAAAKIGAKTFAIPRINFCDKRWRHFGISHHTITVLAKLSINKTTVCFPLLTNKKMKYILNQIKEYGIYKKHKIVFKDGYVVKKALDKFKLNITTMGRDFSKEPEFFMAAGSSALLINDII